MHKFKQQAHRYENEIDCIHACRVLDRSTDYDIIATYEEMPVGYAGFSFCPCKVMTWEYLWVPKRLRKLNVGVPFVSKVFKHIKEKFSGWVLQVEACLGNDVLMTLMKRHKFEINYVIGVRPLEKLSD